MGELTTIILAAGDGTRMRSSVPKLLHKVAGRPIAAHVAKAALEAGAKTIAAVVAPEQDAIRKTIADIAPEAKFFEQKQRLGTAHAAQMARPVWQDAKGYIAIVYGDHPLLRAENFQAVIEKLDAGWDAAILGFEPDDPSGYGRFIVKGEALVDIVEDKDADEQQRKIKLCNACILAFRADIFRQTIDMVENDNAQNEFYLVDLVRIANKKGYRVGYGIAPARDVMGVNSRAQLAEAEYLFQQRLRKKIMDGGASLISPETVYFSFDSVVGRDVIIEPDVFVGVGVDIADNVTIKAFSHLEGAKIGEGAIVGPFARLRPGTNLGDEAKVGNFCELKNANIGEGAKVNHLSYIGDAVVGAKANIGAGTITCNYDGVNKHKTEIGADAFIGSNSALVAPVIVGKGAYVASGSVISDDVADNALAFGRARQINKDGYAPKLRARAQAIKIAKQKES
ncbi:N-acetylglucosamine-1-phosphate uridyltransferase / Glucosamine-1-phosphate N-acetyltransferase [hydrothermal vent metagenome]|uniref:N-acetylglucosamine-1-phosphate uridyltransferase / Glucosamine-1-phosphate N-acetyltransferase n=1 Tax=hydrothermal vent metagenome TaxID=652676 RepID=A0A3B0TEN8_9ZZZZ